MAIEIIIPKLGLTMEEATLVSWSAAAGDSVKAGQVVYSLETDKVTSDVESPADGLLVILAPAGSVCKVSEVVGYLAADQAEYDSLSAGAPATAAPAAEAAPAAAAAPAKKAAAGPPPAVPGGRVKASPLARAMAAAKGLDISGVAGSGPGGRIVKADVEKALAAPAPAAAAAPVVEGILNAAQEIPIAGVRKAVFKNMHLSLQTQAQLTIMTEASASPMMSLRKKINAAGNGPKISFNAIIVKAIAQALRQHPHVNAGVDGDVIKVWKEVHVGVAVDLGKGLIVPKVRKADTKSIRQINQDILDLIDKAKQGNLGPDDMSQGTFTLTNLGAWDIDGFTPIVNNPESAILGAGRIVEKAVAVNGEIQADHRITLSLSFDHRIVDGAPAAAFLKSIKDMLEEPLLMI